MTFQYLTQTVPCDTLALRLSQTRFILDETEYQFEYCAETRAVNLRVRHLAAEHCTYARIAAPVSEQTLDIISERFWHELMKRCATIDLRTLYRPAINDLPDTI